MTVPRVQSQGRINVPKIETPLTKLNSGLNRASPHHKMQDQGDYREHEQQMNQAARNVKHAEAGNPRDQQNHKQDCPDTHFILL